MNKKIIAISVLFSVVCLATVSFLSVQNNQITKPDIDLSQQTFIERPVLMDKVGPMNRHEREIISNLIKKTIQDGLDGKEISYPDLKDYPQKWSAQKVVYTTLNIGDKLRGCNGNINQPKPLLHAIVDSAYSAAFNDPHLPKLTRKEFNDPDFNFYISVLGEQKPLDFKNETDIINQLTPLKYGVILNYQNKKGKIKRGLFLPSMWKKYPRPEKFWRKLKRKSRIDRNSFSNDFKVYIFTAETIKDLDFTIREDDIRIKRALTAFKKLFKPDGHVLYEWNFRSGKISTKNNIVREMGSGYGLAYAYYMLHDKTLQPLVKRFLQYAEQITTPYENGKLIIDRQNPNKVRIPAGASALALLAILYYEQESGDSSFEQLRTDLKNALVSLFEPGVGVHSSPDDARTSPYYDGETWLALSIYNILYPEDKEVEQLIPEMNLTMYNKYHNKYLPNFFHWGTQTAAHQIAHKQDDLMYRFLEKQLNIYIDHIDMSMGSSSCAYAEGLGESALALKGKNEELYRKVLERLEVQQEVARVLQDIPLRKNKRGKISPKLKNLLGLFMNNAKSMKTRNDVTQHCLSALLKSQQVFKEAQ